MSTLRQNSERRRGINCTENPFRLVILPLAKYVQSCLFYFSVRKKLSFLVEIAEIGHGTIWHYGSVAGASNKDNLGRLQWG